MMPDRKGGIPVKPSKEVSSWLIILVVLVTAFVTSWAMLKYKPSQGLDASSYYPPQQVTQNLSPGVAALQGGWQLAAGTTWIPVIRAGAVAPHTDRGVCTECHTVVRGGQQPIPPISASAIMPHEYRGVCSNCHRFSKPFGLNTNPYRTQVATPMALVAAPRVLTPPPATAATEGEWMGLEVTPITQLTARQYGIPAGIRGLLVAEAEAQAALAGIKAGDVVVSINGVPITQMTDFFQATGNGTLTGGVLEIARQGKRLAVNLAQTTTAAAAATPNTVPAPAPAAMRAAIRMPQGNFSMAPANVPAAEWGPGQGLGVAGRNNPGTGWQRQF